MRVAYTGRQMNMPAKMCRAFYSLFFYQCFDHIY